MEDISADAVNDLIKKHVQLHRNKVQKLDAVKGLVSGEVTDPKKRELWNIISVLQDVQREVLNLAEDAFSEKQNKLTLSAMQKEVQQEAAMARREG